MVLLVNRRAYFDYDISDKIVAGVVLTGAEVKSLRSRAGSLVGSYVQILAEGVVLLGAQISPYPYADNRDYDPRSTRKLLLRRKEIYRLKKRLQTGGLSLVPIAFMIKNGKIKFDRECIPVVPAQHYFMGGVAALFASPSGFEDSSAKDNGCARRQIGRATTDRKSVV